MKMKQLLLIKIFCVVALLAAANCEVVAVFEFARHGARGPLADLSGGGSEWLKVWGEEQLTGNGMRMHFHLGREMKLRYPDIFTESFNYTQMEAISTNFNRTISSGLSHFTGLFDMFKGPNLPFANDDKRLQPPRLTIDPTKLDFNTALPFGYTPIAINSKQYQRVLMVERDDCPVGNRAAAASKKSIGEKIMANTTVINKLKQYSSKYGITDLKQINKMVKGVETVDIDTLFLMTDYIIQDYFHNPDAKYKDIPKNDDFDWIEAGYSIGALARFQDQVYAKNIMSDFLLEIKAKIERKIRDPSFTTKYFYYSGHDDLLTVIIQQAGIISYDCLERGVLTGKPVDSCETSPKLASNIVFELHKNDGKYQVKFRYNVQYKDFCTLLTETDDYACSIENFNERINALTNANWKEWCVYGTVENEYEEDLAFWKTVTYIALGTLVILLILTIYMANKGDPQASDYNKASMITIDEERTGSSRV